MEVKLILVEEKKGILDQFTYSKILGWFLLLIAIPTFFILPFVSNNSWYISYFYTIFGLFIISWLIMLFKYYSNYDYEARGTFTGADETIKIRDDDQNLEIPLRQNKLKFYYNGIRRKGFHFTRDFPRSGIAEIVINEKERYFVLISNYPELESLKQLFKLWYHQKYDLEEFTRTNEHYRLIELEKNFDWKRLKKQA